MPELIVISVLPEFSISPPVSAESDAINFSPPVNVPMTFVSVIVVPDVSEPKTNPVATSAEEPKNIQEKKVTPKVEAKSEKPASEKK